MKMYDIIAKKRDGGKLSGAEIDCFIEGYVSGRIPDYQAAALLMAMYIRGLDMNETTQLTRAMAESGEMANLDALGIVADKHSTGGVADTTTLIAVPLVCACGLKVAKMSGRGLGHTGGTVDKLEAIPGMNASLDMTEFFTQIERIGVAVMGQTLHLCPADKLLYSLRDVTATVESIPLIASSIMSKKLACGAHIIVLDVKTGNGAFMTNPEQAKKLAEAMVQAGRIAGRKTAAIISDMSQPLGMAVGNALEVKEAIDVLSGRSGGDLLSVSLSLASQMLKLADIAQTDAQAHDMLMDALHSGRALKKLSELIMAQGGDSRVTADTSLLPKARIIETIKSRQDGFLSAVNCRGLGEAAGLLGAGRIRKDDVIDSAVGFIVNKRIGDSVKKGDLLIEVHANDENRLQQALPQLEKCLLISSSAEPPVLIRDIIC